MKVGPWDTKKMVVVDFETFFDDGYTLRKMRMEQYICDKRFKVHGLGVAYPGGKTDFIDGTDVRAWLKAHRKFGFIGHNYFFDGLIWKLAYHHAAPAMACTRLLANAVFGPAEVSGGNDLESVAERLGFQPKGKIDMFKGKYELSPEEYRALRAYGTNDVDLEYKVFHALLPLLSRPDLEAWLLQHTLDIYINRPLPVNAGKCKAAIGKVDKRVVSLVRAIPAVRFDYAYNKGSGAKKRQEVEKGKAVDAAVLASNDQFGQALQQVLKREKIKCPMKHGKNGMIPALAKADEGLIALKHSKSRLVSSLVTARLAKRSADTQVARLRALLVCAACGGFRPYLNYCGAHTGRWSGGGGLNPQNFPNPSRSTDDFEREVANLIRECVEAPKGHVYTAADAANIEARVLAWWAGQQDLVDAFGDGTDVYSEFAADTFGEEVRKPTKEDPLEKAARMKLLRGAGKEAILGLGYSMGAKKMEARMRARPDVAPLFESGDLDSNKCEAIVAAYRKKYSKVTALWGRAEAAFFKALSGNPRSVGPVLFSKAGLRDVIVTLPSGRTLHYPNVRLGEHADKEKGFKKQWVYGHGKGRKLYGGLLVENIVQAISRDILAEGVWTMEQAGYTVSHHVHDSICCIPPKAGAKKCLETCIAVLTEAPEWGPGLRLGAEGEVSGAFP